MPIISNRSGWPWTPLSRSENTYHPHKLNYELLGNQVPHLHWHLFPRSKQDADHLKPVWLALDAAEQIGKHLPPAQAELRAARQPGSASALASVPALETGCRSSQTGLAGPGRR